MSLELFVTQVPEGQENLYKQTDNGYVLDIAGEVVPASKLSEVQTKLDEFRTNNISLMKQLETVKTNTKPTVDVTSEVEREVQTRLADLVKEKEALASVVKEKDAQLEQVILSDGVKEAALKYGVHESAVQDVLNRARENFAVKDGKAVHKSKAVDGEGKELTIQSWIQNLAEAAPHLFVRSSGAGAIKPKHGSVSPNLSSMDKISAGLSKLNK